MPVTDITTDPENLTMTLVADAAAPVSRLWEAFTDPRQLERFWGPPGWPATFTAFDLRPGGRVDYRMTSPRGERSAGSWEVLNVEPGRSFEVLDSFVGDDGEKLEGFPSMRMLFSFDATAEGSRLTNTTYFTSLEALEQVVAMGAIEGSRLAMSQLDAVLQDLRAYAQGKGTRTELLTDQHVRITRLIEGSRELVWRAHHEPELLRQWLLGPDGWQMIECEVGETTRFVWQQGDGAEPAAAPRQERREGRPAQHRGRKAGEADDDEAGEQRDRPRAQERRHQHQAEQGEAGEQEGGRQRQKIERGLDPACERGEAGIEQEQARDQRGQRRQGEMGEGKGAGNQYGHELQQRPGHGETEPADRHEMNDEERRGCGEAGSRIADAGGSEKFRGEQESQRRREIAHRPAGQRCHRHGPDLPIWRLQWPQVQEWPSSWPPQSAA